MLTHDISFILDYNREVVARKYRLILDSEWMDGLTNLDFFARNKSRFNCFNILKKNKFEKQVNKKRVLVLGGCRFKTVGIGSERSEASGLNKDFCGNIGLWQFFYIIQIKQRSLKPFKVWSTSKTLIFTEMEKKNPF